MLAEVAAAPSTRSSSQAGGFSANTSVWFVQSKSDTFIRADLFGERDATYIRIYKVHRSYMTHTTQYRYIRETPLLGWELPVVDLIAAAVFDVCASFAVIC